MPPGVPDPDRCAALVNQGYAWVRLSRFEQALGAFENALRVEPRQPEALTGRAQCLAVLGRAVAAVQAYTQLLEVLPYADYMRGERFHLQLHCCDWTDFHATRLDLAERVRHGERADAPGSFLAHSDSPADQWQCARIYAEDFCVVEPALPAIVPAPAAERVRLDGSSRLRVAYLSADFHDHATSQLAAGLFEAHDRRRFEIHAFSFGPQEDSAMRRRLRSGFEHFHEVGSRSEAQIAAQVRELDVDIAVDMKGYTLGGRPQIFAHRAAPLQVSFLAYPGTLGAGFMDYLIADRHVIPESERIHYAEQIIYLPGCYQVNDVLRPAAATPRPSRREVGLPETAFVFCCFNGAYKISPVMFAEWLAILRAVPHGVLWLLESSQTAMANLRAVAEKGGVEAGRLVFASRLSVTEHWSRCGLADLFLDTSPYNAHTTASDALRAGVPLLTLAGSTFASRVATSLLYALGLERLSVGTHQDYRRLAIGLAQQPGELDSIRDFLSNRLPTSRLYDPVAYCRQLEAGFSAIVSRRRRGESPSVLHVPELAP